MARATPATRSAASAESRPRTGQLAAAAPAERTGGQLQRPEQDRQGDQHPGPSAGFAATSTAIATAGRRSSPGGWTPRRAPRHAVRAVASDSSSPSARSARPCRAGAGRPTIASEARADSAARRTSPAVPRTGAGFMTAYRPATAATTTPPPPRPSPTRHRPRAAARPRGRPAHRSPPAAALCGVEQHEQQHAPGGSGTPRRRSRGSVAAATTFMPISVRRVLINAMSEQLWVNITCTFLRN